MSAVPKGTVVRVNDVKTHDHGFARGVVVTSTGEDFGDHHMGNWSQFVTEEGYTQYLLPHHYKVVDEPEVVLVDEAPAEVGIVDILPNKVVYGVLNAGDEIYATTADRDFARELKAALGGKRKGVRIFQYTAAKEIR